MNKTTITLLLICTVVFAQQKGTFTDSRDKKNYQTVKIGEQTWMAENLNYNAKSSKCYDNKPGNCTKYGRLYDWNTAMKICPSGWHLPSVEEWRALENFADDDEVAETASGNSTDYFLALPGGHRDSDARFYDVGYVGFWWSSESSNYGFSAYYRKTADYGKHVLWNDIGKDFLFSVRCLQN